MKYYSINIVFPDRVGRLTIVYINYHTYNFKKLKKRFSD